MEVGAALLAVLSLSVTITLLTLSHLLASASTSPGWSGAAPASNGFARSASAPPSREGGWATSSPSYGGGRNDGYGMWKDGKHVPGPRNARMEKELYGEVDDKATQVSLSRTPATFGVLAQI